MKYYKNKTFKIIFKKLVFVGGLIGFFVGTSFDLFAFIKSGTCDPYYASLKSNKVNSHRGPGKEYKIVFEYVQKGTPIMIIAKYDHWRKIKDPNGDESWIHKSLLSPKRFVITISENPSKLMSQSNEAGELVAFIKKDVVMELISTRGNWCKVELSNSERKYMGWIKKESVFGVFENETN